MLEKQHTPSGAKAHQRTDTIDRSAPFRQWHRTLAPGLMATDVDLIEWRFDDHGNLRAAALLEITRVDMHKVVGPRYLQAIVDRFLVRDRVQAAAARRVADVLDIPAYIVLFREDCRYFWMYRLDGVENEGWKLLDHHQMAEWLEKL